MRLRVEVVIERDGDGFHAYSPACRGVHIDGKTQTEALERVKDALILHLESMLAHNEPLPLGPHCVVDNADDEVVHHVPRGAILQPMELELA